MTDPAPTPLEADAVVIGAGPVGLFAVFELGLQEIQAHVIDALPHAGGQPTKLYGDKPIYDIPAIPVCSGQELTDALMRQAAPFQPQFHLGQLVQSLEKQTDGRWLLGTDQGLQLLAKVVFIAAGVGAFQPKRLRIDGLAVFEQRQLFYTVPPAEQLAGRHVVISGGGDAALDAAIRLATTTTDAPARVSLLHRRDAFQAEPDVVARVQSLRAQGALHVVTGQITGIDVSDGRLAAVHVTGPDGADTPLPLDVLLVLQALSPKLGPVADWHLAMERKQLVVSTETFQTSEPGIFAVGDINTYPGKRKLIVCGFHEATLAAFAAAEALSGKPVALQYTTSSTHLHQLLGVGSAATVNG